MDGWIPGKTVSVNTRMGEKILVAETIVCIKITQNVPSSQTLAVQCSVLQLRPGASVEYTNHYGPVIMVMLEFAPVTVLNHAPLSGLSCLTGPRVTDIRDFVSPGDACINVQL
ncbi:hypothetical protein PoB_001672300 [Plakobranchus ocellatus]|uniref:Uncharacterized protein n=1 Tax=Plakobranchus ocellatus TaxID=259542 RepID=A0AAV3Z6X5_9GAST|nr:hypothetical protein PoB_001672300 [Plakobranchus ocellatus]